MAQLFHKIEGSACVLFSRGVYRQSEVYYRGEGVYAKHGGGFIKLLSAPRSLGNRGGTSHPNVSYFELEAEGVQPNGVGIPTFTA